MPKTGRSLIGTVAGFRSEWWPVFDRNGGRLHVGIRNQTQQVAANRCIIAPDSLASGHFAIVDPVGRAILLPLFACLATNDRAICASILGTRSIGSFPSPPRPDQRPCDINYVVSRCCRIILGPCDTEPDPEVDALVGDAIVGMLCLRCRRAE